MWLSKTSGSSKYISYWIPSGLNFPLIDLFSDLNNQKCRNVGGVWAQTVICPQKLVTWRASSCKYECFCDTDSIVLPIIRSDRRTGSVTVRCFPPRRDKRREDTLRQGQEKILWDKDKTSQRRHVEAFLRHTFDVSLCILQHRLRPSKDATFAPSAISILNIVHLSIIQPARWWISSGPPPACPGGTPACPICLS